MLASASNPILLYDGVCGLCNRLIRFVLKRDRQDRFRFAALQSGFATKIMSRHGTSPQQLDTFYLVLDYGQASERLLARSEGTVAMLRELRGAWRVASFVLGAVPRLVRDWGYNLVARNRYRIFGKHDSCLLPEEKHRRKFLDV